MLAKYVQRHVKEDETNIFPQVKGAKLNLVAQGRRMKQRKEGFEENDGPIESGPTDGAEKSVEANPTSPRRVKV